MARKKAAAPALVFPLQGKKVWLDGKIGSWERGRFQSRVAAHGAVLVTEVDETLDYLVLHESRRNSAAQSQAEKKAAKLPGASITTLYANDFLTLLCPSRDLALAILQGGPSLAERWNNIQPFHNEPRRIDLKEADLRNLDLSGFSFHGCDLDGLRLDGAVLKQTFFLAPQRVDFRPAKEHGLFVNGGSECKFDGLTLNEPYFSGSTDFHTCSFRGTRLVGRSQSHGTFKSCDMTELQASGVAFWYWKTEHLHAPRAQFSDASLAHAALSQADLTGAVFSNTNLEEANLSIATLRGADLRGANLRGANLTTADLTGANLRGANLADADLSHANVNGADFTGANLRGTKLTGVKTELATGLTEGASDVPVAGPMLQKLQKNLTGHGHVEMSFTLNGPTHGMQAFRINQSSGGAGHLYVSIQDRSGHQHSRPRSWDGFLLDLAAHQADSVPLLDTIKIKPAGGTLPVDFVQALCELFRQPIPEAKDLAKAKKAAKASIASTRDAVVEELRKKGGVKKWNERSQVERQKIGNFEGCDLSGADLRGIDWSNLKANEANLSKANLQKAKLSGLKLRKANLSGANLQKITGYNLDARNANAAGADLQGAVITHSNWDEAALTNANLKEANLSSVSFLGADLTGANLEGVTVNDTRYDAQTRFPQGFVLEMGWKLVGPPPATSLIAAPEKEEMSFATFYEKIPAVADSGRIRNAVSMLRGEKFSLFAETSADQVIGVVRSQSSSERVYACRLTSQGQYECGTQNLRPCGGLQGKVCKHLLVLILGLTRSGSLDSGSAFQWMQIAQHQSPTFDREVMTATFLKYKSVEAGEVDWRPTETVPEDYYAL